MADGGVAEGFEEVALAGAGGSADDEVLVVVDPLEGGQRSLCRRRDRLTRSRPRCRRSCRWGTRRLPRRVLIEEAWRPASSSASRARTASAGSQRCALAVARTSGAWRRMCGRRSCRSSSTTSSAGVTVPAVMTVLRSRPRRGCRPAASGRHRRSGVRRRGGRRGSRRGRPRRSGRRWRRGRAPSRPAGDRAAGRG